MLQPKSEDSLGTEYPFPGISVCFLLKPSTDFMRLTPIMEGNLLYSQSTDLNTNLI